MIRALAGVLAVAVAATISTRLAITMRDFDDDLPGAVWNIYRFFTVWTNTLVGIVAGWIALGGRSPVWVTAGLALAIAIVGGVYHAVLAQLVSYEGVAWVVDQMVHTVVPLAFIALWAFGLPKRGLRIGHIGTWLAYPMVYCVYAIARGATDGIYPYPFLNVAELGAAGVAVNVVGLICVFAVGGLIILGLARVLPNRA